MSDWITKEVAETQFPDQRLKTRLAKVLTALSKDPERSIPVDCTTWAEALGCYRFFNNPRVRAEGILSGHREATVERMQREGMVLVVQDTTTITFSRTEAVGLGGTARAQVNDPYHLHVSVAFSPSRVNLGVVKGTMWHRAGRLSAADRRRPERRPLTARESYRWVAHYQDACALQAQCPQTTVLMLADREGDMHDILMAAQQPSRYARAAYIIRAKSNRRTQTCYLWDDLGRAPALGTVELTLPRRGKRPERRVRLALRAKEITFTSSKNYQRAPVTVHAVYAQEVEAPPREAPVEWMLLTSIPVVTFADAQHIVDWYRQRWEIEIFFRVLKQGCQVETLRLTTASRLENAVAVYLLIAWRLHLLTMLSRAHPVLPADVVFTRPEWETIYLMATAQLPPPLPPPLRTITRHLAHLGGFLCRKGDREPGVQSLWIGYQRLLAFLHARQVLQEVARICV